jgi:hypothetical protein
MVALLCFFLALVASPFKSKSRLEAENAGLRHQLIVLQRKVRGRVATGRVFPVAPPKQPPAWRPRSEANLIYRGPQGAA